MSNPRSPVLAAVLETLSSGEWVDGLHVVRQAMRVIPPGEASRHALQVRSHDHPDDGNAPPIDELIRSGRRTIARNAVMGAVTRGRIEMDPPELTRSHWRGEMAWKLRDPEAGFMTVGEVADRVDVTESVARTWIRNGFVPAPHVNSAGVKRVPRDHLAAWQAVREAWPGTKKRWMIDPRSLWDTPAQLCPHCNQPITITVTKAS